MMQMVFGKQRAWQTGMIVVLAAACSAAAQSTIKPQDRLHEAITEANMLTLTGSVHPALAHAAGSAAVDAGFPMEHMILLLKPDAAQQAALDQLVADQQDPHSSQFHKFLTPEQYAGRFGASQNDIEKITGWLKRNGLAVEEVAANHLSIVFSGDAITVRNAFKTEVKQYRVNGELHYANASDPQIPAALAGVVKGVVKMHDFHAQPFSRGLRAVGQTAQPLYTAGPATHYLAPADFAMIYNIRNLYTSGLSGAGQSIAVIGRSNIKLSDVQSFRSQFGLPAKNPVVIIAQGADPGFTGDGDATEATLDVQWAGAVAPQAEVKFVVARSTSTADGVDLAAMYAVNHNVAPILSVSFGSCEADMSYGSASGSTELAFYNSLWQQAAAQGISVFVAAGDSGAAGCESASAAAGTRKGVNGICSSPYATCVGGTQFNEGANSGLYWLPGNNPVLGTAQSYIPEAVWNESGTAPGGSELASTGGGASIQWPKPAWQAGNGVPNDAHRDVPDISVSAAAHDGYLIFYNGRLSVVSGTSASAPALGSFFAMVNQKYNSTQGNINPVLYPLAIKQAQGGAAVFHDITSGNNSVPGVAGFGATPGYDLASGLGSIDGAQLANHWRDVSSNGSITVTAAPSAVTVKAGQNATASVAVGVSDGFNWPVTLAASGVPTGITASFSQTVLSAPGSGSSSLQFAAGSNAASGTYTVTITATGGTATKTATLSLTVNSIEPTCSLQTDPLSVSLGVGQATNVRIRCSAPQGAIGQSLALAVSGQPAGLSAAFSPVTLAPGSGFSSLVLIASKTVAQGNYTLAITAAGDKFSKTINLPVSLVVPPNFTLAASASTLSVVQGKAAPVQITVKHQGSFNNAVALSASGMPLGMTATFAPTQFAAPGDGVSTLTIQPALYTPPGTYTLNVTGIGGSDAVGGIIRNALPIAVAVAAVPSFDLSTTQPAVAVRAGGTATTVNYVVRSLSGGFNAPVALSVTGLPSGVTGQFSIATLPTPGAGTSVLSLTASAATVPGTYKLLVSGVGGGVTRSVNLLITVAGLPGFTLKPAVNTLALIAGATFSTEVGIIPQNGFDSPVTLTLGTVPAGVTVTFSSNTISGVNGRTIMTIQTGGSLPAGNYSIPVSGTSTAIANAQASQNATINLLMGSIQTSLGSSSLSVARSGSASTSVTATAANYTGNVAFSVTGLPFGVNYTMTPATVPGSGGSSLIISAGASARPGTYTVTVRTAAGGTVSLSALQLVIN